MICFCWLGFPQYGARAVRAYVRSTKEKVVVVATRPTIPVVGMDELAECEVHWIDMDYPGTLKELLGELPRVITVPAWRFKTFDRFRAEVRTNGGKAILASDNNLIWNFRNVARMLLMRFYYRFRYDGVWVPQSSGRALMRWSGVPDGKIYTGMYSVDGSLFSRGETLSKREKKILFVGQLIHRKNIMRLCQAFLGVDKTVRSGWKLEVCGCGPLKDQLPKSDDIVLRDFVQPEQLAGVYRSARIFALPSFEDHWPLVIHEASLSGCALFISERLGDKVDFLEDGVNGFSYNPDSADGMRRALQRLLAFSDYDFDRAYEKSVELGNRITLQTFVESVNKFA